jgi:hypothetical protein
VGFLLTSQIWPGMAINCVAYELIKVSNCCKKFDCKRLMFIISGALSAELCELS